MEYKVGSLADMISGSASKKKKVKQEDPAAIIDVKIKFKKFGTTQSNIKMGKKRKGEEMIGFSPKVKKLNDGSPEPRIRPKRPKKKKKVAGDETGSVSVSEKAHNDLDLEQESRTIFVGNLIKKTTKYNLKNFFGKFGKIETVRLRSAPVADPRLPKKVAVIKGEFHPDRTNINAYIRYASAESASKALAANGTVINDHTIRVDMAAGSAGNYKKAVFVGNIKFTVTEEDLRQAFVSCGNIHSIRLVRDKKTGMGKGFAFINFEQTEAVELALQLDGEELESRPMRVTRSSSNEKSRGKKARQSNGAENTIQGSEKTGKKKKKNKNLNGTDVKTHFKTSSDFKGQETTDQKAKKLKKQKIKKNKSEQKKTSMLHKLEIIPKSKNKKIKKKASI